MKTKKILIKNPQGIHLRSAATIVQAARKYKSRIVLAYKCKSADSCSILDLLALAAREGAEISIVAQGPDETEAIKGIEELFVDGAGI